MNTSILNNQDLNKIKAKLSQRKLAPFLDGEFALMAKALSDALPIEDTLKTAESIVSDYKYSITNALYFIGDYVYMAPFIREQILKITENFLRWRKAVASGKDIYMFVNGESMVSEDITLITKYVDRKTIDSIEKVHHKCQSDYHMYRELFVMFLNKSDCKDWE